MILDGLVFEEICGLRVNERRRECSFVRRMEVIVTEDFVSYSSPPLCDMTQFYGRLKYRKHHWPLRAMTVQNFFFLNFNSSRLVTAVTFHLQLVEFLAWCCVF